MYIIKFYESFMRNTKPEGVFFASSWPILSNFSTSCIQIEE